MFDKERNLIINNRIKELEKTLTNKYHIPLKELRAERKKKIDKEAYLNYLKELKETEGNLAEIEH